MESSSNRNFHDQSGSGLLRFRSAPTTLFANFGGVQAVIDGKSAAKVEEEQGGGYQNPPLTRSFSGLPPHYPKQNTASSAADRESSYGFLASLGVAQNESAAAAKTFDYSSLAVASQSSSPAGLFVDLSPQNGSSYVPMKAYSRVGPNNGCEASPRQRSPLSFLSRSSSSMAMLSSDIDRDNVSPTNSDGKNLLNGDARFYGGATAHDAGFPYGSWNDTPFSDTFTCHHNRHQDGVELGSHRVHGLSHHLSLPKSGTGTSNGGSGEMGAIDKFLLFQDSVPCKIRAKRGFATHPRSIAERVRRTRISERMRKLQDLVPNMDKQTNTADMLDLAVDYIKDLQTQYKTLNEIRSKCKCSRKQQQPNRNHLV